MLTTVRVVHAGGDELLAVALGRVHRQRRRQEHHQQLSFGNRQGAQADLIANRCELRAEPDDGKVAPCGLEHAFVDLAANGAAGPDVASEPIQRVRRSRKMDPGPPCRPRRARRAGDRRHIGCNPLGEGIARELHHRAPEQPDAAGVPLGRAQSIERHVIGVPETVDAIAHHLDQL
jgi:hypothetical protein